MRLVLHSSLQALSVHCFNEFYLNVDLTKGRAKEQICYRRICLLSLYMILHKEHLLNSRFASFARYFTQVQLPFAGLLESSNDSKLVKGKK